jgi:purine nucleosidase
MNVLIDTDPGTDDALALMMAINSTEMAICGITTVGGNTRIEDTTTNVLRLLDHLGVDDLNVYKGSSRPIEGCFHNGAYIFKTAYDVHGADGLGLTLSKPKLKIQETPASEYLISAASNYRGDLNIIALGPLTNIAKAINSEPKLTDWISKIIVMGGAINVPGNVTPYAEFNIYNDPLAADIVLNSGIEVTLVGLDVTTQTSLSRQNLSWLGTESDTAKLAQQFISSRLNVLRAQDKYFLHDPLAIAASIQPDMLSYEYASIVVKIEDGPQRGRTIATFGQGPVKVAIAVEVKRAKKLIRRLLIGNRG